MSLIDKPNLLSLLILGGIVVVAATYGVITYTSAPDLEHFRVDENYEFAFNFDRPEVVKLPKKLQEISGLAGWKEEGQLIASAQLTAGHQRLPAPQQEPTCEQCLS